MASTSASTDQSHINYLLFQLNYIIYDATIKFSNIYNPTKLNYDPNDIKQLDDLSSNIWVHITRPSDQIKFKIFLSNLLLRLNKYLVTLDDYESLYECLCLVYGTSLDLFVNEKFQADLRSLMNKKVMYLIAATRLDDCDHKVKALLEKYNIDWEEEIKAYTRGEKDQLYTKNMLHSDLTNFLIEHDIKFTSILYQIIKEKSKIANRNISSAEFDKKVLKCISSWNSSQIEEENFSKDQVNQPEPCNNSNHVEIALSQQTLTVSPDFQLKSCCVVLTKIADCDLNKTEVANVRETEQKNTPKLKKKKKLLSASNDNILLNSQSSSFCDNSVNSLREEEPNFLNGLKSCGGLLTSSSVKSKPHKTLKKKDDDDSGHDDDVQLVSYKRVIKGPISEEKDESFANNKRKHWTEERKKCK
jgi:hypothetical protein